MPFFMHNTHMTVDARVIQPSVFKGAELHLCSIEISPLCSKIRFDFKHRTHDAPDIKKWDTKKWARLSRKSDPPSGVIETPSGIIKDRFLDIKPNRTLRLHDLPRHKNSAICYAQRYQETFKPIRNFCLPLLGYHLSGIKPFVTDRGLINGFESTRLMVAFLGFFILDLTG